MSRNKYLQKVIKIWEMTKFPTIQPNLKVINSKLSILTRTNKILKIINTIIKLLIILIIILMENLKRKKLRNRTIEEILLKLLSMMS